MKNQIKVLRKAKGYRQEDLAAALGVSRQTIIVMVRRKGNVLIPNGDLTLLEGDSIILYTQSHLRGASTIEV